MQKRTEMLKWPNDLKKSEQFSHETHSRKVLRVKSYKLYHQENSNSSPSRHTT